MFDMHYDLLTIAYKAYLTGDYTYLEEISKYFNDNNVKGVVANLYFMSPEEMDDEICSGYYKKDVSVLDMFIKAKSILDEYLPNTEKLYSIEGADYISGLEELEKLSEAGLDSLVICWNTESKYASGNRSEKGLTKEGEKLVLKAIDLGLGIDLSHANYQSFNDLCDLIEKVKENRIDVCVYASHSNLREICNRNRNLTEKQFTRLRNIDASVGVFCNRNFVVSPENMDVNAKELYLEHIDRIKNILGDSKVMVATDDMDFCSWYDEEYKLTVMYPYESVGKELYLDLEEKYGKDLAFRIIYGNAKEKIYNHIRNISNKKIGGIK